MKRLLIMVLLAVVGGCGPTAFQAGMADFNRRLQTLQNRQLGVNERDICCWEQESSFVKQLNDNQIAAYQAAVQVFKSDDFSSQEMARRNLQQVCDANTYSLAMQILDQKSIIRHESAEIAIEYTSLQHELAVIKEQEYRRQDAMRDYMMINAIQQNTYRQPVYNTYP